MLTSTKTVTLNSAGEGTVTFVCPPSHRWALVQVVSSTTSTLQTICSVFVNSQLLCQSAAGNSDSADGTVSIQAGSSVAVGWLNGTAGTQATATIHYEEIPK
jgi:hypothetical protein